MLICDRSKMHTVFHQTESQILVRNWLLMEFHICVRHNWGLPKKMLREKWIKHWAISLEALVVDHVKAWNWHFVCDNRLWNYYTYKSLTDIWLMQDKHLGAISDHNQTFITLHYYLICFLCSQSVLSGQALAADTALCCVHCVGHYLFTRGSCLQFWLKRLKEQQSFSHLNSTRKSSCLAPHIRLLS